MTRLVRGSFVVVLFLLLAVHGGHAQTITGAITGTITDPSGAAIPNVAVVATSVATNLTYSATSNAAGVYNLLFLPVGQYRLEALATGFKKTAAGPLTLEVGMTARMDLNLQIGDVTQSIEVQAAAALLQTESAQTGDIVTATQATSLPLNGRQFSTLTLLVPGAITPAATDFTGVGRSGGRPFVNGNREQSNNFLLDGIDINESMDNGVGYNPNVDALAEVKVLTGNASAEYGNANGAIVNAAMKSGTNEFHGNVFEFLRNNKLDANEFFQNRGGAKKQALRRNIFGGTFGGPIVRGRSFFFMDYQGVRQRVSGPSLASVMPADMRAGDLSRITRAINDPLTGRPFAGNIIPQARIVNPAAKALFANANLYPLPNQPGSGAIRITNNYAGRTATLNDGDQADAKIDTRLSDKDNLSGRFSIARYRSATSATAIPTTMGSAGDQPTTMVSLAWVRTFSSSVVNEYRMGYARMKGQSGVIDVGGQFGKDGFQKLGIPGGQPIAGIGEIRIGNGFTNPGSLATDSTTVDNHYQYGNNLTIQSGKHLFKMGGQALRYQQNRFYAGNNGLLGYFAFTGQYTGDATADFLLNLLQSKGRGSQTGMWGHRQWRTAIFFQDDFKATSALTLNLGLRWEYSQPIYEVADRQASIDLVTGKPLFAGQDGNSRALYAAYHRQFMPRIGFAWTPGIWNKTFVIRGAYGITSFLEGTGGNLRMPLNPPHFFESNITYDARTLGDIGTGFADVKPGNAFAGQIRAWDPNLRPTFIHQWNVTIEKQVTRTLSANAAYVGQNGTHLINPREYNQALPDPGPPSTWRPLAQRYRLYSVAPLVTNISGTDSSSIMFYNSLQTTVRKRLSSGLEFMTAYTWSKTITDNRGFYGKGSFVVSEGAYWQNAYDRHADQGLAFFDGTHILTFGGSYALPDGSQVLRLPGGNVQPVQPPEFRPTDVEHLGAGDLRSDHPHGGRPEEHPIGPEVPLLKTGAAEAGSTPGQRPPCSRTAVRVGLHLAKRHRLLAHTLTSCRRAS